MLAGKSSIAKICKMHFRTLQIVYNNYDKSYHGLLNFSNDVSIFNFNHCIDEGKFPYELKHADIIPVHKKKDKCVKENYRPVSILTNISKVYEKLL